MTKEVKSILLIALIVFVVLFFVSVVVLKNKSGKAVQQRAEEKTVIKQESPLVETEDTKEKSKQASTVKENKQVESDDLKDWKTYQNLKYGLEFKYPEIGIRGKKIQVSEEGNLIKLCEEKDSDFCHYLEVFKKDKAEEIETALKRQFLEGKDNICNVKEERFEKFNSYKKTYIITSEAYKRGVGREFIGEECSKYGDVYGLSYFLYDVRYPEIFFFLTIGQGSFFDFHKWVKSIDASLGIIAE